jgi:GntR family transcriptional regulator of vanillate catabolism
MGTARSRQQLTAIRRLRELVIGGHFKPGERISELAAVDRLGISRTPVRLALGALAHEGLLEPRSNGGFVVRDFSLSDMLDAIELRGVLEGTAARMAAERSASDQETRELRSILSQIDALLDSLPSDQDELYEGYSELNEKFHAEMLRLAKSPMLERSLAQVTALPFASPGAFTKAGLVPDRNRNVLIVAQHQHRAIVDAIATGQSARAEKLGQEHAHTAADNLKGLAQHDGIDALGAGSSLLRWSTN